MCVNTVRTGSNIGIPSQLTPITVPLNYSDASTVTSMALSPTQLPDTMYLLKSKDEAFEKFKIFVAKVERKHGRKVKEL
ncbi:hypothetical protein CC2G_004033 [Coprinopsis cinerea AmutBmut pab1-1]|nr:hypothetical protein CC2G_004033 [Coprinopsis cinerea AmutBmut pab1-1]